MSLPDLMPNQIAKLSELMRNLSENEEIKEEFKIEEAQKILRAEVEEMHHAINYHEIGDTSIISVNGEVYIVCKWDSFGVDLTFERETFPVLGLFGAVLTTVNILRGHNGEEDSEDYEQI